MANREWLITRVAITSLSLVTVISICIGGANVLFDVRRDVERVEGDQKSHVESDAKKWERAYKSIDENEEDIHSLELQSARTETNQKEILRRLDELALFLKQWEVTTK